MPAAPSRSIQEADRGTEWEATGGATLPLLANFPTTETAYRRPLAAAAPWRASVRQALRDMRATRRSLDLVDEEVVRELI